MSRSKKIKKSYLAGWNSVRRPAAHTGVQPPLRWPGPLSVVVVLPLSRMHAPTARLKVHLPTIHCVREELFVRLVGRGGTCVLQKMSFLSYHRRQGTAQPRAAQGGCLVRRLHIAYERVQPLVVGLRVARRVG